MIDIHHIAYVGVLLLFLAGLATLALATLLSFGITAISACIIRLIKGREAVTRATADTGALLLPGLLDAFYETARQDTVLESHAGCQMSARDDADPMGKDSPRRFDDCWVRR